VERWRRIALESSQQARRAFLPEVAEPEPLRDALSRDATHKFALDENPAARPLNASLPSKRDQEDAVAMLIGPEGGWTEEERLQFAAAHWTPVSLGPLVLRAETAALAALAILNSAWLLD
jgi:16S rRNA (uracil1498-N3)-methyltransferase